MDQELEGILITCSQNIFYLTGLDNVEGIFLLHREGAVFFTDFRYFNAIEEENPFFDLVQCQFFLKDISDWLGSKGLKKIGFESGHLSFDLHMRLKEGCGGISLIPCNNFVEQLRLIKDEDEQDLIRKSARILGGVMDEVPVILRDYRAITEKDLAIEIEYRIKKAGAQKTAFDIIVATDKRSAYPHSTPTDRPIDKRGLILVDSGAVYKGYNSDITRVMVVEGTPSERIKEMYAIVREAQEAAIRQVSPGALAKDIDFAARQLIEKAGFGDQFGHGTGHGVGIMVHEEPKINKISETVLKSGMVLTIEPGIYLQNEFGIRWEDTVLVADDRYHNLTTTSWDSLMPI